MDVYGKCNWIEYHGVQWVQGSVGNHDEGSRRRPNKPPIAIWNAMNSLTDLEHSMHSMHSMHSTLCPLGAASTVSWLNTFNTLDVFHGRFCKFASCIPCIPCWTWECFSTTFGTGVKRVNTNTSRYWKKKCKRSGANINHNTTLAIATRPQLFGPVQSSTTFRQRKNVRPKKFEELYMKGLKKIGGLRTLMVCANELAWLIQWCSMSSTRIEIVCVCVIIPTLKPLPVEIVVKFNGIFANVLWGGRQSWSRQSTASSKASHVSSEPSCGNLEFWKLLVSQTSEAYWHILAPCSSISTPLAFNACHEFPVSWA